MTGQVGKGRALEKHISGNPARGLALEEGQLWPVVWSCFPAALGLYLVGLVNFQGGQSGALESPWAFVWSPGCRC